MFNFDYSYLSLPEKFFSLTKPNLKKQSSTKIEKASLKNIFKKKKTEVTEEIISKNKGWFSRRS